MQQRRVCEFAVCGLLLQTCVSLVGAESQHAGGGAPWSTVVVGVVSLAGLVCLVKLLAMCAEFCQKRTAYKEFEDPEDVYNPDLNPSSPVASDFSMYPPVENTPDAVLNTTAVVFDPLPDITQIRPQLPQVANTLQMRPKVAMTPADPDNEDDLEDIMAAHDPSHDNMRLHSLLVRIRKANTRSQVPREQISYIKELGSGWFGKVLQGEGHRILPGHKKTKIVVQMLKEDASPSEQLAFLMEATPYREVDHNNVLKLLGQCVDTAPYLTVLELCPFGDLKTYLRSHRVAMDSFNEKGLLLKFAADITAGLQALHDVHFVHRDFAARNCALSSDLSVKIGDYGLSEELYKEDYEFDSAGCGVPVRWLAPECVLVTEVGQIGLRYITKACNIWSFGVTLWEILTFGQLPYSDLSNDHVIRLVIREQSLTLNKPDVNVTHIDRLYELMRLCWSPARSRPSLRQLRIMLLHLLSSKIHTPQTASAFDEKWNKLLPRKAPQVVPAAGRDNRGGDFESLANGKVVQNGGSSDILQTVSSDIGGAVPYNSNNMHENKSYTNKPQQQIASGDSDHMVRLNPATLGAGPGAGDRAGLSLQAELASVHRSVEQSYTSPVNELSLAAELSDMQQFGGPSGNSTPVNDASLQQLSSSQQRQQTTLSSSVDSQLKDEIMILDNRGEPVGGPADTSPIASQMPNTMSTPAQAPVHIKIMDGTRNDTPGRSESIISAAHTERDTPGGDFSGFMSPPLIEEAEFDDFTTSTPVKSSLTPLHLHGGALPMGGGGVSFHPHGGSGYHSYLGVGTPGGSTTAYLSTTSGLHSDSDYHTALTSQISSDSTQSVQSASTTPGTAGSLTSTEDDRSFLGQKKFAAMLQTVVTSFDEENPELYSSSFGEMSFEAIPEDHEGEDLKIGDPLQLAPPPPGEREGESITPTDGQKHTDEDDIDVLTEPGDDTVVLDGSDSLLDTSAEMGDSPRRDRADSPAQREEGEGAEEGTDNTGLTDSAVENSDSNIAAQQPQKLETEQSEQQDNLRDVIEDILQLDGGESKVTALLGETGGHDKTDNNKENVIGSVEGGGDVEGGEDSLLVLDGSGADVSGLADTSQSPLMSEGAQSGL